MGRVVKKSGKRRRKSRIVVSKNVTVSHCDQSFWILVCLLWTVAAVFPTTAKAAEEKLYISTLNSLCDNLVNLSERFMYETHFIHFTGKHCLFCYPSDDLG